MASRFLSLAQAAILFGKWYRVSISNNGNENIAVFYARYLPNSRCLWRIDNEIFLAGSRHNIYSKMYWIFFG